MRTIDREQLRQVILNDENMPSGLRDIVLDEDFWAAFRPTGPEIYAVIQKFGTFANGKPGDFAEALRLVRIFLGNDF